MFQLLDKVCFSNDKNLVNVISGKMDMEYILPGTSASESSEDKSNSVGGYLLDSDEDSDDSDDILHYFHVKVTNKTELLEQFKQIGSSCCTGI